MLASRGWVEKRFRDKDNEILTMMRTLEEQNKETRQRIEDVSKALKSLAIACWKDFRWDYGRNAGLIVIDRQEHAPRDKKRK